MEQNKTGKYLKYAIGEIVLVVIGILIALSINNWNESQKSEKAEMRYYNQMLAELIADKNEVSGTRGLSIRLLLSNLFQFEHL